MYHVQTEGSGGDKTCITSCLFHAGAIITTKTGDYGDVKEDSLWSQRVKEMIQEQHKALLKQLIHGDLDQQIIDLLGGLEPAESPEEEIISAEVPAGAPEPAESPQEEIIYAELPPEGTSESAEFSEEEILYAELPPERTSESAEFSVDGADFSECANKEPLPQGAPEEESAPPPSGEAVGDELDEEMFTPVEDLVESYRSGEFSPGDTRKDLQAVKVPEPEEAPAAEANPPLTRAEEFEFHVGEESIEADISDDETSYGPIPGSVETPGTATRGEFGPRPKSRPDFSKSRPRVTPVPDAPPRLGREEVRLRSRVRTPVDVPALRQRKKEEKDRTTLVGVTGVPPPQRREDHDLWGSRPVPAELDDPQPGSRRRYSRPSGSRPPGVYPVKGAPSQRPSRPLAPSRPPTTRRQSIVTNSGRSKRNSYWKHYATPLPDDIADDQPRSKRQPRRARPVNGVGPGRRPSDSQSVNSRLESASSRAPRVQPRGKRPSQQTTLVRPPSTHSPRQSTDSSRQSTSTRPGRTSPPRQSTPSRPGRPVTPRKTTSPPRQSRPAPQKPSRPRFDFGGAVREKLPPRAVAKGPTSRVMVSKPIHVGDSQAKIKKPQQDPEDSGVYSFRDDAQSLRDKADASKMRGKPRSLKAEVSSDQNLDKAILKYLGDDNSE